MYTCVNARPEHLIEEYNVEKFLKSRIHKDEKRNRNFKNENRFSNIRPSDFQPFGSKVIAPVLSHLFFPTFVLCTFRFNQIFPFLLSYTFSLHIPSSFFPTLSRTRTRPHTRTHTFTCTHALRHTPPRLSPSPSSDKPSRTSLLTSNSFLYFLSIEVGFSFNFFLVILHRLHLN